VGLTGRDKEFRTPKTTYVDFKHIEMDRVLTMLFPRLKYDGYASRRPPRGGDLTVDEFMKDFLDHPEWFDGFADYSEIVQRWIETDLLDLVNRGKANQAVAAPRPLHGNTYKFRNAKHSRDYGAAEQVYWMLYYARKGKGQAARDALKRFFFPGYDFIADRQDPDVAVDVESQAILRWDHQVTQDMKDSKEPFRYSPICIGRADLLADDILRILAYEKHIPRIVLVDYIRTLLSFHLGLYHLQLLFILPRILENHNAVSKCALTSCKCDPESEDPVSTCTLQESLLVSLGDTANHRMEELAKQSLDRFYRQIPTFVRANFAIKKLDEMADYLGRKTGKITVPTSGYFSITDLIKLLSTEYKKDRDAYFKFRIASLVEGISADDDVIDPEIRDITSAGLAEFDAYLELLMAYRSKYHRQYIVECLDSLLQKNKDNGLMVQSRRRGSPRRFELGVKLLEVLIQVAVIDYKNGQFVTSEITIEELIQFLKRRYGIWIDRLPPSTTTVADIRNKRALRMNVETLKKRLREIGFYVDRSDSYVVQHVTPRYKIMASTSGREGKEHLI